MMLKLVVQFILGVGVGLYGYLTPGYINLGILQLSIRSEKKMLTKALLIISLVEIPYCFVCMSGMKWLMQQETLLLIIRWLIVAILFLMVVLTLIDSKKPAKDLDMGKKAEDKQFFRKLLFFAIFNPFQLSAWTIWGGYFMEKDWFDWSAFSILLFSVGGAIGVFVMLKIYAVMGQKLVKFFSLQRKYINYGVAVILFALAIVQLVRNLQ